MIMLIPASSARQCLLLCSFAFLITACVACLSQPSLRMIAKKWRPLKFFTAEQYEWAWNNFDFWVVVLSVLGGLDIIPGLGNQVQLFRLLRLLRVLKLLKMIVELQMILKGLAAGISSVLYVAMLMTLIFYLYGCIGFILFRDEVSWTPGMGAGGTSSPPSPILLSCCCALMMRMRLQDPQHFDTILEAFVITLFRACTLEDWTDLFYTSYFGCESYGYDMPMTQQLCSRYGTGTSTIYLAAPEPCNMTYAYQCYDPFHQTAFNSTVGMAVGVSSGAEMSGQPYHTGRILFQVVVFLYWVVFIFIGSFVLLSLFIGAITIGMQSSLDEAMEEKAQLEANRKAFDRDELHKKLAASGCKEIKRLWNGLERAEPDDNDLPAWQRNPCVKKYKKITEKIKTFSESGLFNNTITGIIVLASVMVGLGEDDIVWAGFNGCSAVPCPEGETVITDTIEFTILMIFAMECIIKIIAEGVYPHRYLISATGAIERWNTFDFIIVVLGIVGETGVFGEQGSILMVLRLLRLLRVLKLVRALPELQVIVSALISGLGSIGYVSILLILIYYIYAILGCIAFASNDPWHFRDVTNAMLTLFRASTFEDWTDIMYINMYGCDKHFFYKEGTPSLMCNNKALGFEAHAQPLIAAVYFLTFILLAALVMMSLFIGVVTTSMDSENKKQEAVKYEEQEISDIREEYGVDDHRFEEFKQIFDQVSLPESLTIDSKDLGFLLDAVSDGTMPQLIREERIDEVIGDRDAAELTFCAVLRVLCKLERDMKRQKAAEERAKKMKFTKSKQRDTSKSLPADGGERSFLDEDGRLVIEGGKPPKRSIPTKVRRLLAHSQGFEIPESVEIDQRGIAMLVSSVATMRLHAQEAHAAAPTHIVAPEGNKALMGFFAKPKGVRPGDSGDNSSLRKGVDGKYEIAGGFHGPGHRNTNSTATNGPTAPADGSRSRSSGGSSAEPAAACGSGQGQASESADETSAAADESSAARVSDALEAAKAPGGGANGEGESSTEYLLRLLEEVESLLEDTLVFGKKQAGAAAEATRRGTRSSSPTTQLTAGKTLLGSMGKKATALLSQRSSKKLHTTVTCKSSEDRDAMSA